MQSEWVTSFSCRGWNLCQRARKLWSWRGNSSHLNVSSDRLPPPAYILCPLAHVAMQLNIQDTNRMKNLQKHFLFYCHLWKLVKCSISMPYALNTSIHVFLQLNFTEYYIAITELTQIRICVICHVYVCPFDFYVLSMDIHSTEYSNKERGRYVCMCVILYIKKIIKTNI